MISDAYHCIYFIFLVSWYFVTNWKVNYCNFINL